MAAGTPIDKTELLAALRARIATDLAAITETQKQTQAGATHEESRPENDKDTRALESTYLARGLAERVAELQSAASALATLALREFTADSATALTALVTAEDDDGATVRYFLAPAGAGLRIAVAGDEVTVVTPQSPLGTALLGKRLDDEVEVSTPQGKRTLTVTDVA